MFLYFLTALSSVVQSEVRLDLTFGWLLSSSLGLVSSAQAVVHAGFSAVETFYHDLEGTAERYGLESRNMSYAPSSPRSPPRSPPRFHRACSSPSTSRSLRQVYATISSSSLEVVEV